MPITIRVSAKDQIAHVLGAGEITVPWCAEAAANLINHSDYQPHFGIVVDFRQATNTPHMSEMRELAAILRGHKDSLTGMVGLVVKDADAKKASVMCMLVRAFGAKMEAYGDPDAAMRYLSTGRSWL